MTFQEEKEYDGNPFTPFFTHIKYNMLIFVTGVGYIVQAVKLLLLVLVLRMVVT
jgi:hypothetical protein